MRELFHPTPAQLELSTLLNALGDPVRLTILSHLVNQTEVTCGGCQLTLSKSALSHHFKVLREAGLINVRVDGTQRFLSLRTQDIETRFPGLLPSVLSQLPTPVCPSAAL